MDKFLVKIGIAAFATLMLAFGAIELISSMNPKSEVTATASAQPVDPPTIVMQTPQMQTPTVEQPSSVTPATTITLPLNNPVTVADLKNLSAQVNLRTAKLSTVDKEQWKKALPKAEQLLQGACDCEEKNWLNHFVETGNYALSDSKDFDASAELTRSLPKNDDEATTHQISE